MIFDRLARAAEIKSTTLKQLTELFWGGAPSASGVAVTPTVAMQHAPVFSCVRVLAESAGLLPMQVYRLDEKRQRTKVFDHSLSSILKTAPNDFQTSQEFVEMMVAHLALRGNFYAQIVRLGNRVLELLPWHPDWVTTIIGDGYEVGFRVTFPTGDTELYDKRDVLHIKLFSLDGFRGVNPVAYQRESIALGIATQEHGARLFGNGARPGGILTTDEKLSEADQKRILNTWREKHEGGRNAHRVAVLYGGMKWQQMGLSAEDSQFLESRKYSRSEIAGIFRVPPHLIGDLDRATFSNIEHQALEFVTYSLMPYLRRIEQRIEFQLFTKEERAQGYYVRFSLAALLRADMTARGAFYTQMEQCGVYSPNEIRDLEDLSPREGGDIYLTPANMNINGAAPVPAPVPPKK